MKELNYGFSLQEYENGAKVDTLQTGDGKSEFSPIYLSDQVGIAISHRDEGVIGAIWQIKFPNRDCLTALKNAVEEIEAILIHAQTMQTMKAAVGANDDPAACAKETPDDI